MTQVTDSDRLSTARGDSSAALALEAVDRPANSADSALTFTSMRRAATVALTGGYRSDVMGDQEAILRGHLDKVVPAVERAALTKPLESVPRAVAIAHAETARALMKDDSGPARVQRLARELLALCDHHDVLTGVRPWGTS